MESDAIRSPRAGFVGVCAGKDAPNGGEMSLVRTSPNSTGTGRARSPATPARQRGRASRSQAVSLLTLDGLTVLPMEAACRARARTRARRRSSNGTSGESVERISRASHKTDFFPLSNHFISQDNSIFCGPVSSAIVLNALRLGKREGLPRDRRSIAEDEMAWLPKGADPFYGKYTPNNVLSDRTKTRLEVLGRPILIDGESEERFRPAVAPAREVLRSHGLEVVMRVVDERRGRRGDPA